MREREKQRETTPDSQPEASASRSSLPYDSLVRTDAPISGAEMEVRGTILAGFREATLHLFGDAGLERVASMASAEVREQTVERLASTIGWYPERYVLAWYEALWSGPCLKQREKFVAVLDRMMDCGFGRVRRSLLSFASPSLIFNRAPSLWRYDHSHGELTSECGAAMGRVKLANHPYTENPLACLAIAEIYRYCVALSRAKGATETHYREPSGELVVHIRWTV
jgi:hypothetical protein